MHTIPVDFASPHTQAPQVVVLGQQADYDMATVSDLARFTFGEAWNGDLAVILPARNEDDRGFQTIICAQWGEQSKADGAWYTRTRPGSVLAMPTADCATVIGWQPHRERVCLVHAGRPALTPHGNCQCQTVVSRLANVFGYRTTQAMTDVHFTVTPHIGAAHFRHDFHDEARRLVDPFRPLHACQPEYQVLSEDGQDRLDVGGLIRLQLERWYSVPPAHISPSAHCTYNDPALASRRAKDTTHNLTLVRF